MIQTLYQISEQNCIQILKLFILKILIYTFEYQIIFHVKFSLCNFLYTQF